MASLGRMAGRVERPAAAREQRVAVAVLGDVCDVPGTSLKRPEDVWQAARTSARAGRQAQWCAVLSGPDVSGKMWLMHGDTDPADATRKFVVVAEPELVAALRAKKALYAVLADRWWLPRLHAARSVPRTTERRRAREELDKQRRTLRRKGQLLDTINAIMTHHLAIEMTARGWDHEWKPLPEGVAGMSGRRWGSLGNEGTPWTGTLPISIDGELAEQLLRATYWTSEPATTALQELADARANDEVSPTEYAVRYSRLAKQVITGPQVLRAALIRATHAFFPTTEPLPDTEPRLWDEPELLEHIPAGTSAPGAGGSRSRKSA